MSSENNKAVKPDDSQNPQQMVDQSRRSFAKVGAALVPVMMTLANRSAWGGTNICTQSGFTSFANQNGVVSHSANRPNPLWKTPAQWAGTSTWPAGFGQATYDTTSPVNNPKFTSTLADWGSPASKTYTQVKTYEGGGTKVLADSVFGTQLVTNPSLTLLAALTGTDQLLAYRLATLLNNKVSPVPAYFLTDQATLAEFGTFYSACTSA